MPIDIPLTFQKPKSGTRPGTAYPGGFHRPNRHPLALGAPLPATLTIELADLVQAALEVGYGPKEDLYEILRLPPAEVHAFSVHQQKRFSWLLSGITFTGGVITRRPFKALSESSESTTDSYYFGMMFGYLAFKAWLPPANGPLLALHFSTFTGSALVKAGRRLTVLRSSRRSPDLLCRDTTGQWHVVEAKGGGGSYRSEAVRGALVQLDGIASILDHASGRGQHAPRSSICSFIRTHTRDNAAAPWKLWIVDPAPQTPTCLIFNADLAELKLMAIQQTLISTMPRSPKRPLTPGLPLKRSAVTGVYIQPMAGPLPLDALGPMLVRFDRLERLVVGATDAVAAVTPLGPPPTALSHVSQRVRDHLTGAELVHLETLFQQHLGAIATGNARERAFVLARLLFAVLGLDQVLQRWRAQRAQILARTRERVAPAIAAGTVRVLPLTCGAIVLGYPVPATAPEPD